MDDINIYGSYRQAIGIVLRYMLPYSLNKWYILPALTYKKRKLVLETQNRLDSLIFLFL